MTEQIKALFDGQMPQAVLFDLDGTLLDSVPDLSFAIDLMLDQLALPKAGEAKVRCWVGNGAAALIERALADACDSSNQAVALFDQARGLFFKAYEDNLSARSRVYPGVIEALKQLQQQSTPLALITNKPIEFTLPLLAHFGLDGFFIEVIGGDSLEHKKPHPLPLQYAAQTLNASIEHCLMVGDSRSDIQAAKAAGCPVLAVTYGYNHGCDIRDEKPDVVCDDLTQVFVSSEKVDSY